MKIMSIFYVLNLHVILKVWGRVGLFLFLMKHLLLF